MTGTDLARAAEALVGAPFRLHGRDPAHGLDCVGVIVAALAACGIRTAEPHGYGLRNRTIGAWLGCAEHAGLVRVFGPIHAGDVLLVRPGPGQHHLLVATGADRFVHAHAGLRRVVTQPGPLPWPVKRHWHPAS
jgi:cell wall-associated NlpC family hydrolase